ncbi:hypothetical protein NEOC95_000451 [Neochlamydia sp. AcF95]|nr:hypothetical protein [Neochlamydia sp. AcF95]
MLEKCPPKAYLQAIVSYFIRFSSCRRFKIFFISP